MTEDQFWGLITLVTPIDLPDDIGAFAEAEDRAHLAAALEALSDADVIAFFHMFSAKLHALDTPEHYKFCIVHGGEASGDVFLYARCHVLARGPKVYATVLSQPRMFPHDLWFEDLLSAANEAYDRVYALDAQADACPSYESFSNPLWRAE